MNKIAKVEIDRKKGVLEIVLKNGVKSHNASEIPLLERVLKSGEIVRNGGSCSDGGEDCAKCVLSQYIFGRHENCVQVGISRKDLYSRECEDIVDSINYILSNILIFREEWEE